MGESAEIRRRIQSLCERAHGAPVDPRLLSEMEDLLAQGYVCALRGDALGHRLQRRTEALMQALDRPGAVAEFRAAAREHRSVTEATRALRLDLSVMRQRWIALH